MPMCVWHVTRGTWGASEMEWVHTVALLAGGCWLLAAGCWLLAVGHWPVAVGWCLLVVGRLPLMPAGCWLPEFPPGLSFPTPCLVSSLLQKEDPKP
jgi:hypothetical protein